MHALSKLVSVLVMVLLSSATFAAASASHVVVVVWDGMRPDFVSKEYTPTLARLAKEGVTFANHHPVYISSTEVNGAALATGVYPGQNGIIGNKEYRPSIDPLHNVMTAAPAVVRQGDASTDDHFLNAPTLEEMLHAHGMHTAVAGAKTVTLLHDRFAAESNGRGADIFEGHALPAELEKMLTRKLGPFPPVALPKVARDRWTTHALLGPLWGEDVPPFSLLWLSEPDYTQHHTGPGSKQSLRAIRSSDRNLRRVLRALKRRGLDQQTDVIVVSDHAFSTILQSIDVAAELEQAGFMACREFPPSGPQTNQVMVVGNGGTAFLYVIGHAPETVEKLVHFLQAQPYCGVLFTRQAVPGTFRLAQGHIDSSTAPDVVMSLRWSSGNNRNGVPGMLVSDASEYAVGGGMHASLSPFDLHNTCIAAGPDFRRGYRDELPTGNIDIVPTVLDILGVKPTTKLSGRVLSEALKRTKHTTPQVHHAHAEASWEDGRFTWHQYLDSSEVEGVTYFDRGNGEQSAAPAAQARKP